MWLSRGGSSYCMMRTANLCIAMYFERFGRCCHLCIRGIGNRVSGNHRLFYGRRSSTVNLCQRSTDYLTAEFNFKFLLWCHDWLIGRFVVKMTSRVLYLLHTSKTKVLPRRSLESSSGAEIVTWKPINAAGAWRWPLTLFQCRGLKTEYSYTSTQWRTQEFCSGGGSKNSVEDRGQREQRYGAVAP
jgi:hypothetical protein